ncbi:MAG: PAS domain-containing sensor histidine kinase [Planctomycetota bacterium]
MASGHRPCPPHSDAGHPAAPEDLASAHARLHDTSRELAAINADLSNLLANTESATVFLDHDLRLRRFTPGAAQLLGLEHALLDQALPHDRGGLLGEDLTGACRAILAGDAVCATELGDGTGRCFLRRLSPYRRADGPIDGVVMSFTETTALRNAEHARALALEELESERQRLALLFDQAPVVIAMYAGPDHRCVLSNRCHRDLLGGSDVVGRPVAETLPGANGAEMREIYDAVRASKRPHHEPERVFSQRDPHSGVIRRRIYNCIHLPHLDHQGCSTGVMLFGFDVTGQVEARRQIELISHDLRHHLLRTKAIINHMGEGLVLLRPDGHIESMNPAAVSMHNLQSPLPAGFDLSTLQGLCTLRKLDGTELIPAAWPHELALRGETFDDLELLVEDHFDGRRWTANFAGTCLLDDCGEIGQAIVTLRDVSERHATRRTLAERTQQLERANEDLRRFANHASHDLQRPLRLIASYLDLLADSLGEDIDGEARLHLQRTTDSALQLRRMICDLLAISETSDAGPPQLEDVDPAAALACVREELDAEFASTGAQLTCDPLPWVRAVPDYLVACFKHLLHNALDHGGPDPRIQITVRENDGEHCVFAVRDHGPGVPLADRERVFDLFHTRLNADDTQPDTRTGTGLAWCRKMLALFGGSIWIENADGGGAMACFVLPLARSDKHTEPSGGYAITDG